METKIIDFTDTCAVCSKYEMAYLVIRIDRYHGARNENVIVFVDQVVWC